MQFPKIDNMRLTKFRVMKYRSIEDSGEIPVDDKITTFVGINESGKTNVLRALRKLNNVIDTKFNRLTENPIWHFKEWNPTETFITATFALNQDEQAEVTKIDSTYSDLKEISFSRQKDMKLICHLKENQIAIPFASFNAQYLVPILPLIEEINPAIAINNPPQPQKPIIQGHFSNIGVGFEGDLNIRKPEILAQIKSSVAIFRQSLQNIANQHDVSKINALLNKIESEVKEDATEKVKNYLITKLPRFIYFENIGVIDSRINLQTLVQDVASGDLSDEEITAKTLLDLAKLDPKELLSLNDEKGKNSTKIREDKDALSQLCNQASISLSNEMDSIWSQNEHTVQIEVNGTYLRVWVINKQDNVRLQLEERSRGYQWYFSFYVVFNVESEGRHKDSILLLDEPALFLHALGQKDFLEKALPQLSEKNQIIYTTHSPFLLDLNRPYAIHTVTIDKEAEKRESHISREHWATDKDALFPLQSAVGYHLAQSMFIGQRNIILEGITDFWIINSASTLFSVNGKTSLDPSFVLTPAGGGTKTVLYAKTYVSQELKVGVLLDSDNEGKLAKDQLIRDKILKTNQILVLNDIFKESQPMSIEDIFPEDYYLKFVEASYKNELQGKRIVLDSSNPMLVKRIEAFFAKNKLGTFDKTKPSLAITKEFGKVEFKEIPPKLVENFEKLFTAVNEVMKK